MGSPSQSMSTPRHGTGRVSGHDHERHNHVHDAPVPAETGLAREDERRGHEVQDRGKTRDHDAFDWAEVGHAP